MYSNQPLYTLTNAQRAIWVADNLYPGTSQANLGGGLIIDDPYPDSLALNKAMNLVIKNNDALRLEFLNKGGEPKQYVTDYLEESFQYHDFDYSGGLEAFQEFCQTQMRIPFLRLDNKLYEFAFFQLPQKKTGLFAKFHHLIIDGWGSALFCSRFMEYYRQFKENDAFETEVYSYLPHIEKEKAMILSERYTKQEIFWNNLFDTIPELMTLNGKAISSLRAKRTSYYLSNELTDKINVFCQEQKLSPFSLFYSAISLILWRITGKKDMVIATPILNRVGYQEKNTLGLFMNDIPTRTTVVPEQPFVDYASQTFSNLKKCLKNQHYPVSDILKNFREKHKQTSKLFDIIFSFENAKVESELGYKMIWAFSEAQFNSLSIHVSDRDNVGSYTIEYDYLTEILREEDIYAFHTSLCNLFSNIFLSPQKQLSQLSPLSKREENQLLNAFNATDSPYDKDLTFHELFESQAEVFKNAIAIECGEKQLTYQELNQKANQLARFLRDKGVSKNDVIGLMVNRSLEMIVGILGILKTGGAYVPIDPTFPTERTEYMLRHSQCKMLLTNKANIKASCSVQNISLKNLEIYSSEATNLPRLSEKGSLAYVLYTSGSTGEPKGVMVHHKAISNFVHAMSKQFDFSGEPIVSLTTLSFDIFFLETLFPLTQGTKVVIADEDMQKNPRLLFDRIEDSSVTVMQATPSRLRLILSDKRGIEGLRQLKHLLVGGESFPTTLLQDLRKVTNAKIYNMYGPTETTIWSTMKDLSNAENITIGKPIANTQIYILDEHLLPVSIGTIGEIFISGDGVSLGYLNKPELTEERFLPNPFISGTRMYKTGDLGKWLPDGEIECLGRNDSQVKIRGFRVELGEIEKALLTLPSINDAVLLLKRDNSNKDYLCAYLTGTRIPDAELRTQLSKSLPSYMIPTWFVWLEKMPLTLNGKIDRKKLPEPNYENLEIKSYTAPTNLVEQELAKLWAEALEIDRVGIDDNLFALGGDSLVILEIMTGILDFNWNLSAQDFYEYPTVRQLAKRISSHMDKETAHRSDIYRPAFQRTKQISFDPRNPLNMGDVLLTGATGFLGSHILHELLFQTNAKIYCLVRGSQAEERLQAIMKHYFPSIQPEQFRERVFVIPGDISLPLLGLSSKDYENLAKRTTTIIHSGAIVKHYGNYDEFAKTNLQSTMHLVSFCQKYHKQLNHISTISVSGNFSVDGQKTVFTEDDFYIGQDYASNVYIRSKFEAENIILRAMDEGLSASIYRVGILTGRHHDGVFQTNVEENAFYRRLKSILSIKKLPKSFRDAIIEFTPVDSCAQAIVKLVSANKNNLVFHMFNHNMITGTELLDSLKSLNYSIELLDDNEFLKYVNKLSKKKEGKESLSGLINDLSFNTKLDYNQMIVADSTFTADCLKQIGFEWGCISPEYLEKVFRYMKSINFI